MSPASASSETRKRPLLLCYDGSPDSTEAIELAGELIGGGPALVLHVWLPPSALFLAGRIVADSHPLAPAIAEFDEAAHKEAERIAAEGAEAASRVGFEATPLTERAGHGVWRAIVKIADEHDARAVIVGSHGRSRSCFGGARQRLPRSRQPLRPAGPGGAVQRRSPGRGGLSAAEQLEE